MTTNPSVLSRVEEIRALVEPDKEVWIDGSQEQMKELRQFAIESGVLQTLNEEVLPECTLHRTTLADAARAEKRTFVCCDDKNYAGPTNNWEPSTEMYQKLKGLFKGIMKGRTMYVVPFCLGSPDSSFCKAGIEITDSLYVALNMVVLAQCGKPAVSILNSLKDDKDKESETSVPSWFFGLHSTGVGKVPGEDNRYICHFPQDNAVWSINTGFGSGAFLSKEAISLRLASCVAKEEGWLAEHMAIVEIEDASGDVTYIALAFPAGCGKTSLAMMTLPRVYSQKGYKIRCISEDVAWLKKGIDGRLWAVNPEKGIFGAAPGINAQDTPNLLAAARRNSIFTNVAYNTEDNTVWWEGLNDDKIATLIDWKGEPFVHEESTDETPSETPSEDPDEALGSGEGELDDDEDEDDDDEDEIADEVADALEGEESEEGEDGEKPVKRRRRRRSYNIYKKSNIRRAAHSGSRFTTSLKGCPSVSPQYDNPEGVPISAIVFGGKRSKTIPLVYQSFDWEHGVFVGSILGTEFRSLSSNQPVIRRDSMAMVQLCGYSMPDYWKHWLKMGKRLGRKAPKIFNVNWFKLGPGGTPIWPGFGENIRVLDWIVKRSKNPKPGGAPRPGIVESPVGYIPKPEDINIEDLEYHGILPEFEDVDERDAEFGKVPLTVEVLRQLLVVEKLHWKEDVNGIKQFYAKFGDKLPEEFKEQLVDLEKRLMSS